MKTSYFAKYKGDQDVNIAMKAPDWFKGSSYPPLFPKWSSLKEYFNNKDENVYIRTYYKEVLI
jgi:hypothetical protein